MFTRLRFRASVIFTLLTCSALVRADPNAEHPLLPLLQDELKLSMEKLVSPEGTKPYFLQYTVTDEHSLSLSATLGAVVQHRDERHRMLDVDVRCGDYKLDSTRQIRGPGVRTMTEDELIGAGGVRQQTGAANPVAQEWADTMTARYEELAVKDPIFGELRNIMDLALVGALISKEGLREKAGFEMSYLMDPRRLSADDFEAPKQVQSMASVLKKRGGWLVSVSGGVEVLSWEAADKQEIGDGMAAAHQKAAPADDTRWWWN